jgi:hypothetical protein
MSSQELSPLMLPSKMEKARNQESKLVKTGKRDPRMMESARSFEQLINLCKLIIKPIRDY